MFKGYLSCSCCNSRNTLLVPFPCYIKNKTLLQFIARLNDLSGLSKLRRPMGTMVLICLDCGNESFLNVD